MPKELLEPCLKMWDRWDLNPRNQQLGGVDQRRIVDLNPFGYKYEQPHRLLE
ncbi:MAG: hypothetical protein OEZ29_03135 [Candidatus Bathyarchaeota archaeon]|nr:hypothetical protein [Candidatus Bathyarchaeota archaeon]